MKRLHLFEFEDQPWFPGIIRNGMTDYLKFVSNQFDLYDPVKLLIGKALRKSGGSTVVDLASGGGGGWSKLVEHLVVGFPDLRVILTDLFPNADGLSAAVDKNLEVFLFEPSSIDARDMPPRLKGLRTQFLSLHHFRPADAKQVLQNAVDAKQPIAIFEAQKHGVTHLVKFSLLPIGVLLMMPFIRPFKWSRIVFTYLILAIPLFTMWDGLVSVLRTYSIAEMEEMTDSLNNTEIYSWEIGEAKSGSMLVTYLLGYPK